MLWRIWDPLLKAFTLSFTAMAQVPSQGSTDRIGASDAPILIQIENSDQPTVRPQSGMQQADMIYEYISEYGIPRLTAVYWHPPSSFIGPVRSCRLITVQLEQMYRGMIYCSGANDYVLGKVWQWPNVVYDYADSVIAQKLSQLPGVAKVNVAGKFDRPLLIESVLYPSRQIVEGYRITLVVTSDGRVVSGYIRRCAVEHR